MKIIEGTEKDYDCDTLILSVGLIPENELSLKAGVELDNNTKGPIIDENYQTSVEGIFVAGNVLHVHDLVDFVSLEGERLADKVAKYIKNEGLPKCEINIIKDNNIGHTIPQKISGQKDFVLSMRVKNPLKNVVIEIKQDDSIVKSIKMKKAIIKKAKDKNAFEKYVIAIFEKFDAMGEDISNDDIQNIPSIEIRNITSINSENNSNNNLNHEEVIQMDKNITRWEYKIVNLHEDGNIKTNYLGEILPKTSYDAKAEMTEDDWNLLGNAGWEATGNTFTTNGYSNKVLLKRLKSN